MRGILLFFACFACACAQTLPGTQPLTIEGDPARLMVDGIRRHLLRLTAGSTTSRRPDRAEFQRVIGVADPRVSFDSLELAGTLRTPAVRFEDDRVRITAVRWPATEGVRGEGLYFEPKGTIRGRVVFLDDADAEPEQSEIPWRLAQAGYAVLSPVLIDRATTWSGRADVRFTTQTHREFLYRMAYPQGRHIIGFEVQKVLAAVDWFREPVTVWGYGEGGLVALYAAAIDQRIETAVVSGYFDSRQSVWQEPIYRNVWGLLKNFGDAEIAAMAKRVIVETRPGPSRREPVENDSKKRPGSPGVLAPADPASVEPEVARARALGANIEAVADALPRFAPAARKSKPVLTVPADRRKRQFDEIVAWCQRRIRLSEKTRDALWAKADTSSPEKFQASVASFRTRHHDEIIGRLPAPDAAMNPRTRLTYKGGKWDGYEVSLDLWSDVFAYGVLLVPKDLKPGERRPVVVCQHGLEGRPQSMFGLEDRKAITGEKDGEVYRTIGSRLADLGFIVYMPQNPYIGDFRPIARIGNPLKLTLFSYVYAQTQRMLDWLETQPFVDKARIGFYGLSYGGKTAMRIPPVVDRYAAVICSGDFNEWVYKLTTVDAPYTYMFTHEYEILEFGLADFANHAESALLIFPRPFMVERGHRDGVGSDEWVTYEYAKVKRFYDEMGLGERTGIEYFNGVHRIHGVGTVEFLKRWLKWPTE